MIFKSSMRRGISLEVIVEEDDNAEVSLDPRMQIYDNNIDLSSNSSSTSSCSGNDEREDLPWNSENEIKDNYERLKVEKEKWRQKRETDERWRRLGKQRSLSCETLTILDVGDDNLSQEQWEEEARDWDLEEENHIDQSISRRRILQSSMDLEEEFILGHDTRSDSFGKEITEQEEFCVDDDETYDSKIDFDEEESEHEEGRIEEKEEESDPEKEETNSNSYEPFTDVDLIPESELSIGPVLKSFQDPWLQDPFSLDSDTWITVGELTDKTSKLTEATKKQKEVTFSDDVQILESYTPSDVSDLSLPSSEELEPPDQKTSEATSAAHKEVSYKSSPDVIKEPLPPIKTVKDIFDNNRSRNERSYILDKLETSKSTPLIKVVEKDNFEQTRSERKKLSDPAESKSLNKEGSIPATHNKEVHLEELPAPHTVASVRQLFEKLPLSINNFHKTQSLGRFDHVRSNPTSKILRFDRAQKSTTPSPSCEITPKGQILSRISDESASLPRPAKTTSPVESTQVKNSQLTSSRITISRSATISLRPSQDMSTTGIFLRKPKIMSRFNVKKALEENPRYFHIRREDKLKEGSDKYSYKNLSKDCDPPEKTQSQNPDQREIHNLISPGRLHWLRDTIDRSDAESLSSDSSEDSGVSKDFNSSILSKFSSTKNKAKNNWHHPNDSKFSSDPSFKWIDPAVLEKIRAVGTTVIYFGPRHRRPNTKCSNFTSLSFREKSRKNNSTNNEASTKEITGEFILKRKEEPNKRPMEERLNTINTAAKQYTQVPPRIVGVLRKTNGNPEEATKNSERKINTIKDSSSQVPKLTTGMTNGTHERTIKDATKRAMTEDKEAEERALRDMDAMTPEISRVRSVQRENKATKKPPEAISVIYDFTRK